MHLLPKASTSLPYCHGAPLLSQNKCDALDTVLCASDALSDRSLLYNRICLTDDSGDVTEPIHGDACRNQQAQGACVKDMTRLPEKRLDSDQTLLRIYYG